ncbi:tetratricopeptide (TPR) repeat protein [Parabacteroides sp. PF5-5]|uniref:hypothetical protein n=1 Tax=unclassified Parabacteroides TaxID=2649774 RepID=UPI002475EAAD|nr:MULTISPECIES: hypothetical protein [unclassified Parabacteroides]MDH6303910.1 tetratricopeptide (TPR) repeat protein [Parabacteroides sp. PH5-39]MDH6314527.1 tetratricopeptide (TPR) repeat protein [Parabacteroides sp. PF5-13]MDH6318408.1 tetratricopeptide (TPR) repeat protein [Parabacteroides sp. PH5-13]MDH6322299.1 tetratricopeptide (TPR) repeat protein [Parabacteroides sp. PH5-8]MDH6325621.1 tetratricopeptide (TPR) repeat protein [Parabacteroides sp. PH5-41]
MNFSFYIYGTPNGYNQYPADSNSVEWKEFALNNTAESQLSICRKGQLIFYAYMRRLQEKTNYYLGFCLVFNGVYCQNPQKLFSLFDKAFDDVLMKGELLRFDKGKCLYTINKFSEKQAEIEYIKLFFKSNIDTEFNRDFIAISPSFKIGNGIKTISVKETGSDILAAMAEYDIVHISNNEKTLSELERTHKLLTELYAEKQELQKKYRKLVAQKKQYKVVLFLCLVVFGCTIGLFAFNKRVTLQKEILTHTNLVRDSIALENIYWNHPISDYHLFHNCNRLSDNNSNVHEGSVERAFKNNKKHLCQECVNKVVEYKTYRKNTQDFYNAAINLQNKEYFNEALGYCNKALAMRPDDQNMLKRKQDIELKK